MSRLRSLGHIHDYAEIPAFEELLTHSLQPRIQLFSCRPNSIVALALKGQRFLVLSCLPEQGSAAWLDAIEQGRRLGLQLEGTHTCEEGVLAVLVQEHAQNSEHAKSRQQMRQDTEVFSKIVTDSTPIDWLRQAVGRAASLQATDLHLEVRGDVALMRVRRDGVMRKLMHFPSRLAIQGLSAGYTLLAEEGSRSEVAFNSLMAQSAMIPMDVGGEQVLLRYQSHPTPHGFDAVMRVLRIGQRDHNRLPELDRLGYSDWQRQILLESCASSWGGVFIAGSTGSGKTTTLCSLLRELARGGQRKIVAIEDPVEYLIPGVTHLSVRRQGQQQDSNPFEQALLAFLRMDPDVGMFGEIRDHFSGAMAQTAIQTGHKLLTTVHATSAISIVSRLISQQIGLNRADVCSPDFLSALVFQTLVPLNCPHCAVPAESLCRPAELQPYEKWFGLDTRRIRSASQAGCPHCRLTGVEQSDEGHVGVAGMTVCAEVLPMQPALLKLLKAGQDQEARMHWQSQRVAGFDEPHMQGKEAWGHALYEVACGRLDPYHFERCFGAPELLARTRFHPAAA